MINGPEIWMLLAGLVVIVLVVALGVALGIRLGGRRRD